MSYFDHQYLSNSDIKAFKKSQGMYREDPANLQQILDLGSYFHSKILEPHKAVVTEHMTEDDVVMAQAMSEVYWKDPICRQFAMANDFQREKECYETVEVGPYRFNARCKMDGVRERMGIMLELKGLKVEHEKQFQEALVQFDYDQAVAHYMITAKVHTALIVGIQKKKQPKLPFRWIVKQNDDFYAVGEQKLIDSLAQIREFSPEDVELIAQNF